MTNNFFKKLKNKLLTVLLVLCLVSTCALGLVACGTDNTEQDPTYSYTDSTTSTSEIGNVNFADDIVLDTATFPSSATSWSLSTDNSATSSSVSSGVVNTSEEGWKKVIDALGEDREFLDYVKKDVGEPNDTDETTKARLNKDGYFVAPVRDGATDNFVYMINNYRESTYYGVGTAQKVVSSNVVSLEKDNYYKLSVLVNTYNLRSMNPDIEDGAGANIRLVNTVNGTSQGDVVINNIKTNGWERYTFLIKADETYNCTLNLVLGLGYGSGATNLTKNYVEGTVYFDDITFEKIGNETEYNKEIENKDVVSKTIVFGENDKLVINKDKNSANNLYLYNMELDTALNSFYTDVDFTTLSQSGDAFFTKALSNPQDPTDYITSKTLCGDSSIINVTKTNSELKLNLTKASATVKLIEIPALNSISVAGESYTIVNFKIKNGLSNFGSTDIAVDVYDVLDDARVKQPAVATFSTPSDDFVDCTLYVKNNFEGVNRKFEIELVLGPSKVASVERANDFATGEVVIKNLRYQQDTIESENNEDLRDLILAEPSATVSLYAGYGADFDDSTDTEKYSFTSAPGNIGEIALYPTNPAGYDGVVYNHAYVAEGTDVETAINTRSGKNGTAGLVNSKYIRENIPLDDRAEYGITLDDLGNPEEDIQPLMINNTTASRYGFVAKQSTTISANAIASFSVKVRVLGNAKAFIYLANSEITSKEILTFDDFTVNTDVVKGVNVNDEIVGSERLFEIMVTPDMCNEDGWATVSFYIVNGKNDRQVRLELWNGSRYDDNLASHGIVFFNDVSITASSAFTKSEKWNETFSVAGNPLYEQTLASYDNGELYAYKRTLTEDELKFNAEYPDQAVEYYTTYVWAKNDYSVFADYSTLENTKEITNPYDSIEEEETSSGCAATTDPSTFWLSFSTIILVVALALAFIALIVKNVIRKRKANASDAKSHYKVTSRISRKPATDVKVETKEDVKVEVKEETTETTETNVEETTTETQVETETETTEETTEVVEEDNGYVYGDVIEDFTVENTDTENNENK